MLDKTRKPLFPKWKQKKTFFETNSDFFSLAKCRITPKNAKGGSFWNLLTYIQLQNIKKLQGGLF